MGVAAVENILSVVDGKLKRHAGLTRASTPSRAA